MKALLCVGKYNYSQCIPSSIFGRAGASVGVDWASPQGTWGVTILVGELELNQGMGQGAAGVILEFQLEHQVLFNLLPLNWDSEWVSLCMTP